MSTVKLSSGAHIPLVGLGTARLTGYDDVFKSLDAALACGYRMIDTAQMYKNEAEIGQALTVLMPKHGLKREDLFITSKLASGCMSTEAARPAIEQSLRDLKIDYADLFLVHQPKPRANDAQDPKNRVARREAWLELEKLHAEGKLKSIGVSNYEIRHLDEMSEYAKIQPSLNQCEFHPYYCRRDLVDEIRRRGIQFQAYTSLARNNPDLYAEPILNELAKKYNVSISQILLAWPVVQGIIVIPKSSNADRLIENFEAQKIKLTPDEVEKIWGLDRNMKMTQSRPWEVM